MRLFIRSIAAVALTALLAFPVPAVAGQEPDPAAPSATAPQTSQPSSDRAVDPSQPDFTLIALPTNLRMPRFASAFRVTHRFTRSLAEGSFSDLLGDAFGVDGGAQVGLEYRFGIFAGTQIGIHRTSDKAIQLFAQHQLLRQATGHLVTIDALGSIEGADNFKESYAPAIGAVVSRTLGRHGAIYLQPVWINNTNPGTSEFVEDNNSFLIGFGGRLRVRPSLYLVAEAAPRTGYAPGETYVSFAVEGRAGGHSFQVNFSNGFGTTLRQIARGGFDYENWYLGFNISRKFF
jgi:Membrane bound beta barrel domain (DUF5777)